MGTNQLLFSTMGMRIFEEGRTNSNSECGFRLENSILLKIVKSKQYFEDF